MVPNLDLRNSDNGGTIVYKNRNWNYGDSAFYSTENSSCMFADFHLHIQPSLRCMIDQSIEAEFFDAAFEEVVQAGLCDAEFLGGL